MPSLKIIRPHISLAAAAAVYIGALLAGSSFVPDKPVLIAIFAAFLITAGGMIIDSIFAGHSESPKKTYAYAVIFFIVGNALAYAYLASEAFYLSVIATVALLAYARLKHVMLAGNIIASIFVAVALLYGAIAQIGTYDVIAPFAVFAFLMSMGNEIYKTIEEALGDKSADANFAVRIGVFRARVVGALFAIAAVVASVVPYVLHSADVVYLGFAIIADVVLVAAVAAPMRHSSKLTKAAIVIAFVAMLLGAYSMMGLF